MYKKLLAFSLTSIFISSFTLGQELIIYPSDGQSKEQQNSDEGECFIWARDNSGYDPLNAEIPIVENTQTTAPQRRGGAIRGALGGAAVGGIVDGSDGAETGAAVGALVGLSRQRRANQQAAAQQQQQANAVGQKNQQSVANAQAEKDNYNRYYATCLEGRGYAVN